MQYYKKYSENGFLVIRNLISKNLINKINDDIEKVKKSC